MKKAFMFPGQGSQEVGMGEKMHDRFTDVERLFERAEKITKRPIRDIAFNGPKEVLGRTSNTQVALVVVSLGVLGVYLKSRHHDKAHPPDFVTGHSVGEFTAAVAAGSMTEDDAIAAVFERGLAMEHAGDDKPGKMAALLKIRDAVAEKIARDHGVYVANYNIEDSQIVISGDEAGIDAASSEAETIGARARALGVTIAAHSPMMESARLKVKGVVDGIDIADPAIAWVANRTGGLVTKASEVRDMLPEQLVGPVRWSRGVNFMRAAGVGRYIEFGPRDVLSGMVKRQLNDNEVVIEHAETKILESE